MPIDRQTFGIISVRVEDSDNKTRFRVSIPKDVRQKLDWDRKFKKGMMTLFWLDPMLDFSTALLTSIYDEALLEYLDNIRSLIISHEYL